MLSYVSKPCLISALAEQEVVALAGAEAQRNGEPDPEKRKYPGGAFDPVGLSKDGKVCCSHFPAMRSDPRVRRHVSTGSPAARLNRLMSRLAKVCCIPSDILRCTLAGGEEAPCISSVPAAHLGPADLSQDGMVCC